MTTDLNNYKNLLQVFREGLIHGILSKQEVTAWADAIIMQEDEPDYFFIELSLAHDIDEIVSVIGNLYLQRTTLTIRALFGVLHHKVANGQIAIEKVLAILDGLNDHTSLFLTERCDIYQLEEFYDWSVPGVMPIDEYTENVLLFLDRYSTFTLESYREWENINQGIEETLVQEESEENARYEAERSEYQRINRKATIVAKIKKNASLALFCILAIVPFLFVFAVAIKYQFYITEKNLWPVVTMLEVLLLIKASRAMIIRSDRS